MDSAANQFAYIFAIPMLFIAIGGFIAWLLDKNET